MSSARTAMRLTLAAIVVVSAILLAAYYSYVHNRKPTILRGAVMMQDSDPRKELPIADVQISVADNLGVAPAKSDSSGGFSLQIRLGVRKRTPVILQFRHPNYRPLDIAEIVGDQLYIAHMVPLTRQNQDADNRPSVTVGNVRVRYSIKATQDVNIGSAVRVFQVVNRNGVLCKGQFPCSPDGKWKAGTNSTTLDAGAGNEFRDARISCIAGPCPFTRIESDGFSKGGQTITATAVGWSDTATFLVEAEVFRKMASEVIHESYPVIFGLQSHATFPLSFRIPGWCKNASIAVNGKAITTAPDANGFVRIERRWKSGDKINLQFPMSAKVTVAHDANLDDAPYAAVTYGPLSFVIPIADLQDENTPDPAARWKYALDTTADGSSSGITVERTAMPAHWNWPLASPLKLRVPMQRVEWDGKTLPSKPAANSEQLPESLTLVPYGCTKFRVALMPVTERTYRRS